MPLRLSLHEFHENSGAQFSTLGDAELVSHYGDPLAEYKTLTEAAGVLDLSFRGRICLTGSDRVRFLHGQVTNDVKGLRVSEGCYAALITAKGKMQSDLNIFCLKDELLLDFEPGLTALISERLEKYIIADDVQIVDVSDPYGLLAVEGPRAAEVVRSLGLFPGIPNAALASVSIDDAKSGQLYLANNPRLGMSGFDLFVPSASLGTVAEKLIGAAKSAGGGPCGWNAFEMARIEAGIPRFGLDMDGTNIPLEAGLEERGISFTKGCYIGQEVISRIRTYGQVAKALRGLKIMNNLNPLPASNKLYKDGKEVGYITSTLASPKLKENIALGYVRKEVNQPGTDLVLKGPAGEAAVRIVPLPFT